MSWEHGDENYYMTISSNWDLNYEGDYSEYSDSWTINFTSDNMEIMQIKKEETYPDKICRGKSGN